MQRRLSPAILTTGRQALWFGIVITIWLIVAFLTSIQAYVSARVTASPQPFGRLFQQSVPWYFAWAILTPFVVWLASRTEFQFRFVWRFVFVHLVAGLATVVAQALLYVAIATYVNSANPNFPRSLDLIAIKLSGSIHVNLMIYVIIVGLVVAGRAYSVLHEREIAAAHLETQLAEAQTMALRAQLQPHFLFNTLNAISALVEEDTARAKRMVASLGDLLRMSLEEDRGQECRFADELDFTEAYLAIEEERLGDRLRVVREIAPDTLHINVPALVLQPLVENAVRHGIASLLRGGTVTIAAATKQDYLELVVSDDGRGAGSFNEGVGLRNTRKRLRQLYGDKQSMDVTTSPDLGFRVFIKVPR